VIDRPCSLVGGSLVAHSSDHLLPENSFAGGGSRTHEALAGPRAYLERLKAYAPGFEWVRAIVHSATPASLSEANSFIRSGVGGESRPLQFEDSKSYMSPTTRVPYVDGVSV
jgi:hypothetical protein